MIANGKTYNFKVVFETNDEVTAFGEERRLIALYGRHDKGKGPLMNHTDGGEGASGRVVSDETRKRISQRRKGSTPWNIGVKGYHFVSSRKNTTCPDYQKEAVKNRTQEQKKEILKKRRETLASRTERSEKQISAAKTQSVRMRGENNPNFGKVGYFAGKVGPRLGMVSPNKGRKKGPDGKLYRPEDFLEKFGLPL